VAFGVKQMPCARIIPLLFFFSWMLMIPALCQPTHGKGAVAVNATGYATMQDGQSFEEAHREALNDALFNSVTHAGTFVHVTAEVKDMRLKEKRLRTHGAGFVESMEIVESGLLPNTELPVYRVKVRSMVKWLAGSSMAAETARPSHAWKPVLAVDLKSKALSAERCRVYRSRIVTVLQASGITVSSQDTEGAALEADVWIVDRSKEKGRMFEVNWEMSAGEQENSNEPFPAPRVNGKWILTQGSTPSPVWWQRLGIQMAQDASQLWNSPRTVRICIHGLGEEQVQHFMTALGPATGAEHTGKGGPFQYIAERTLAGNPLFVVEAALEQAGLLSDLKRTHASLTRIDYMLRGQSSNHEKEANSALPARKCYTNHNFSLIAERMRGY
jgi:hypothetical protein